MVYNCQIRTYEAGRDATERQTCAPVANSVANRRFRLIHSMYETTLKYYLAAKALVDIWKAATKALTQTWVQTHDMETK